MQSLCSGVENNLMKFCILTPTRNGPQGTVRLYAEMDIDNAEMDYYNAEMDLLCFSYP